ncbi:unnamed protein product [Cunninghamella blakesleeana]
MISQILKSTSKASIKGSNFRYVNALPLSQKGTFEQQSKAAYHLTQQQKQAVNCIPSLLHSSARVRSFSHATAALPLLNNQIRLIGFSTIPRITLTAFRFPALIAGTTVAGVTVANNKLTEWKDKSTAFLFEGLSEAQKLIRFVQEEAEGLDISIPEIHLRVPTAITDFLSSINSSESEKSSTNHVLLSSAQENSKNQEKSSNDNNNNQNENGGNQGNNSTGVAAAAAAAIALTTNDEDSEQHKKKDKSKTLNPFLLMIIN